MGCSCKDKKKDYDVIVGSGVVYSTNSEGTANMVAKRYKDGKVRKNTTAAKKTA